MTVSFAEDGERVSGSGGSVGIAVSWRKLAREESFVFVILARGFALVGAPLSFRSISDICGCGLICKDSLRNVCRHKCPAEAHVLAVSSEEL